MRKYHLDDPPFSGLTITVYNDKDCILCKHCQCIWDYTNGPYMFFCDLDKPQVDQAKTSEEHTCEKFEDREGEQNEHQEETDHQSV